ncbi:uncharacterized protein LOC135143679 [Zophobas morio]|uniref:uncharacterized protein LOC135143679 n=1 Tax=Zophobas morio TaxID=2755281 RepID=UPI0030828AE1
MAFSICSASYLAFSYDVVPITGRRRLLPVSERYEMKLGAAIYKELLKELGGFIYPKYHPIYKRVEYVGTKLARVSGLQHFHWEFHVVESNIPNCFVIPGGKVFLFTGLLRYLDNNDSLAAVLGHEIGHVLARHGAEKQAFSILTRFIYPLFSIIFNIDPLLLTGTTKLLLELPFSRRCEKEADHIGMILMARACFDPFAAIRMWEKLQALQKNLQEPMTYISTHPSPDDRANQARSWLKEAYQERAVYCS